MESQVELLGWDTEFFGYRVARVHRVIRVPEDLSAVRRELQEKGIVLAYYASPEPIGFQPHSDDVAGTLVDRKTTFIKSPRKSSMQDESVWSYPGLKDVTPKLVDLAVQSGVYSRFNVDPRIGRTKFEDLYRTWMERSVHRQIADEVLVCGEAGALNGVITLGRKDTKGVIGILAVDEGSRGKGFGRNLIQAAENWCVDAGLSELEVVTQADNVSACRFYKRCGFTVESVVHVYHFWRS